MHTIHSIDMNKRDRLPTKIMLNSEHLIKIILRGKDKNNMKQEIINLAVSNFVFLSHSIRLNQLLNRSLQLIKI